MLFAKWKHIDFVHMVGFIGGEGDGVPGESGSGAQRSTSSECAR